MIFLTNDDQKARNVNRKFSYTIFEWARVEPKKYVKIKTFALPFLKYLSNKNQITISISNIAYSGVYPGFSDGGGAQGRSCKFFNIKFSLFYPKKVSRCNFSNFCAKSKAILSSIGAAGKKFFNLIVFCQFSMILLAYKWAYDGHTKKRKFGLFLT